MKQVILESTLTYPRCGHQKAEQMPEDACQWFYECAQCHTVLCIRNRGIAACFALMERCHALPSRTKALYRAAALENFFQRLGSQTHYTQAMTRNRRTRMITVLFALVSLLFMQLAVAGYACPGSGAKVAEVAAMAEAGMPCAESMAITMDDEQPGLCHAHCQAGQQSADKYQLPSPVAIDALPADFSLQIVIPPFLEAPLQEPHLQRTTAPPVAIRNCCFRL